MSRRSNPAAPSSLELESTRLHTKVGSEYNGESTSLRNAQLAPEELVVDQLVEQSNVELESARLHPGTDYHGEYTTSRKARRAFKKATADEQEENGGSSSSDESSVVVSRIRLD